MISCRIIVLNYNGRELMEKFLPSVIESARASQYSCRVTVLDNCSADDSCDFLRSHYPEIDLMVSKKNKVLCSYNDAVAQTTEDVVILLNNDIKTEVDFVDPLVSIFEKHEDAFFVATHGDRPAVTRRWGILAADINYPEYNELIEIPGYSFSAGIGAFDRKKFLELGGYDELFLPGRYEDVDLCFRGWKAGWKGYYQPMSRKFHVGGASFDKAFKWDTTQEMVFRNSLLFMLKNVTDPFLQLCFWFYLPMRLVSAFLTGKWFVLSGFLGAVNRIPKMMTSKRLAEKRFIVKDWDVIQMVNQKGR